VNRRARALPETAKLHSELEEPPVCLGGRGDCPLLGLAQPRQQTNIDDDGHPRYRSLPPPDELPVDDDDVGGEGIASLNEVGGAQALCDRAAIF
jgi:hypothetical protein